MGSGLPGEWRLAGCPEITTQFETLAKRTAVLRGLIGASLLNALLEELRSKSFHFSYGDERVEPNPDGSDGPRHLGGTISRLCEASAKYCSELEGKAVEAEALQESKELNGASHEEIPVSVTLVPTAPEPGLAKKSFPTALGRNLDRLRRESGWSYDAMAVATEVRKQLILGHVNKGKDANLATVATYAIAFTEKLGRPVTVAELEADNTK